MAHAATASHDYAQDVASPREFSVFLRLRQGGAARPTYLVTEAAGGTMISVGADAACDWQIRAAFVPPRAFSILVVGGRAFVRSGPEPGLLLDGKPVDDGWVPLTGQARVDIGLARFELRAGFADSVTDEPVLELSQPRAHKPQEVGAWSQAAMADTAVVQSHAQPQQPRAKAAPQVTAPPVKARRKRTMETQEYGWQNRESSRVQRVGLPPQTLVTPPASARPEKAVRNSTIELRMEELDYVGTIPMPRRNGDGTGEYTVSPSLLGADEVTRVTGGVGAWRYVGMGMFFASAYGAWLYLLDRI